MPLSRAYNQPAALSAHHPSSRAARKGPSDSVIGLILAFALLAPRAFAADPPPNLARLVARRETETQAERSQYTYRQTVTIEELTDRGSLRGDYKEVRDI